MTKLKQFPKISIVMPSYNQCGYLNEAIDSIFQQEYPNLELIVMDGGSTDRSVDIIKNYQKRITYWQSEVDGGQADAINKGWEKATGEIVTWLNSDDLLEPNALHSVAREFMKNNKVSLVVGSCRSIDVAGKQIGIKNVIGWNKNTLLFGQSFGQPATFIARDVIDSLGMLDPKLNFALDWAFFLKILFSIADETITYLPETLAISREYEGTKSRTGLAKKGCERRKVLQAYRQNILKLVTIWDFRKAIAGTYWVQGTDSYLAGCYFQAIMCGLRASIYAPLDLINKIAKLGWLTSEAQRRKVEQL